MEDTESVVTLIDSTTSKIQQLQKAFAELESHRAVTLNLKWKELEEHFHGLERSLKRRFHELEDQEKEYETKTRKAQELLEKREAAVVAKEQASLERLQEKRDAAVFAITNALEKHRKVSPVEPAVVTIDVQGEPPTVEDQPADTMAAESNLEESNNSSENGNVEVISYPELVKLCEVMDSEGLHKFISDNRKNLAVLREEIPLALKAAENPAQLVLNSLEDFYPMEVPTFDGKKDSALLGLRRTCIMLMECLSILLACTDLVSVSDVISEDIKEQAKAIAEEWKPKLDGLDMDASNGNSLPSGPLMVNVTKLYPKSDCSSFDAFVHLVIGANSTISKIFQLPTSAATVDSLKPPSSPLLSPLLRLPSLLHWVVVVIHLLQVLVAI